jgi:hypothetical protein
VTNHVSASNSRGWPVSAYKTLKELRLSFDVYASHDPARHALRLHSKDSERLSVNSEDFLSELLASRPSMNKSMVLFCCALSVASQSALAKQTFLDCTRPAIGERPAVVDHFVADPASSTVTYYDPDTGATKVNLATFGPTSISWIAEDSGVTFTSTISRVDLAFTTTLRMWGNEDRRTGTCKIGKRPSAQF